MKRSKCVLFVLFAGLVFCGGAGPACAETTWYVDDDAPADFATIQAALDAAYHGDTIIVRDGYYVASDISFHGKAIHLRSENGPESCIVDAASNGCVFIFLNELRDSILDGFTITGGDGNGNGGGVHCYGAYPTITNNTIVGNTSSRNGGGVYTKACSPLITKNTITNNTAGMSGGGIYTEGGWPSITENTVTGNTATSNGGGICIDTAGTASIADCIVTGNVAKENGGGISGSPSAITGSIITDNCASGSGGGIYGAGGGWSLIANSAVTGNTADEEGGGVFLDASQTVINNTIVANRAGKGGGVCAAYYGTPTITSSILWGNEATAGSELCLSVSSGLTVIYSDIAGGQSAAYVEDGCTLTWDPSNIDANPLFANPGNYDYHLKSEKGRWDPNANGGNGAWVYDDVTSPCINVGDTASDYSNEPMFNGGRINMGAYGNTSEASQGKWILPADTNHDSEVNVLDLLVVRNLLREDPASDDNWRGDVNEDGVINVLDLLYTRNRLGTNRE